MKRIVLEVAFLLTINGVRWGIKACGLINQLFKWSSLRGTKDGCIGTDTIEWCSSTWWSTRTAKRRHGEGPSGWRLLLLVHGGTARTAGGRGTDRDYGVGPLVSVLQMIKRRNGNGITSSTNCKRINLFIVKYPIEFNIVWKFKIVLN